MSQLNRVIFVFLILGLSLLYGQEMEMKPEEMPSGPPQPLDNPMANWMVGVWEGTSESNMGTSKDWMEIKKEVGGQFLVTYYKSKATKLDEKMLQGMAEQMKMPVEEAKKMMMSEYMGRGLTTINPMNGELVGYWFDSYRDMGKGSGKVDGFTTSMKWKSPYVEMERTMTKVDENTMEVTYKGKDAMGIEFSGTATMKRK